MQRFVCAVLLMGCSCGSAPEAPPTPPSTSVSAASGPDPETTATAKPVDTGCAIVAMELMVNGDGRSSVAARLDANGDVYLLPGLAMPGEEEAPNAKLDPRGCIVSPKADEPFVERTADGSIWTLRAQLPTAGNKVVTPNRTFEITPDGKIKTSDDPNPATAMWFKGYEAKGLCAAQLLLVGLLSAMPSMAVSDGNPQKLRPPPRSVCPEFYRSGP